MKQVLLTLGVLLIAMFGFYWVNNRFAVQKTVTPVINDKEIYFEVPDKITTGAETEMYLKAKYSNGKLVSYTINFSYDSTVMKVLSAEVNKEIFDKKAEVKINESIGKVTLVGENTKNRDKLVNGEVVLATIKVKGLKKGGTMIYVISRPEVGILEGGKVTEGNFQMPNFKVNFL